MRRKDRQILAATRSLVDIGSGDLVASMACKLTRYSNVVRSSSRRSGRAKLRIGVCAASWASWAKQRARQLSNGTWNVSDHSRRMPSAAAMRSRVNPFGEASSSRITRSGTGSQLPRCWGSRARVMRDGVRRRTRDPGSVKWEMTSGRRRSMAGPGTTAGCDPIRRQLISSDSTRYPACAKAAARVLFPARPEATSSRAWPSTSTAPAWTTRSCR